MPVDAARRIRTARLRGGSEPLIRRGALLLEDALRTASLPGTDSERLLLIRSLSLGVIRSDKSAALVARQLEQQAAELARHAVYGDDPRAADAQAVYFHDRLDAVVALIQRLSRGVSGDGGRAWYWRSAVPAWQPGSTPTQAGRVLLGYLLNLETGPQSLAQAFQRLVESRSLDVILDAVQEEDGPVLLQRCGWQDSDRAADSVSAAPAATRAMPFPRVWHLALLRWITRWGVSDARSLWLVAMAVQSWRPESVRRSEAISEARTLLRTIAGSINAPPVSQASDDQSSRQAFGETGEAVHGDDQTIPEGANQRADVPVYTPYAGFWFLIPLLLRAGFGRAIQAHPEWADFLVPQRLLCSLADRLSIPLDDSVCLWLPDDAAGGAGGGEPECHTTLSCDGEAIVTEWRMSMRRWCRLQARLGLVNLVRRQGWVSLSKTHVEVWMPLSEIDLRIRRAGLDIDPGWVPWLGQVIRFHYDAEGRPHGSGGIAGC